jgi:excisionase family DNA binding protein
MQLLTVKELSAIIKVKEPTLYSWANKGLIPSLKLNGLLRFDQEEITDWISHSKWVPASLKNPKPKPIRKKYIDSIIDKAIESTKNGAYNLRNGEARPNRPGKGGINGSI